MLKWAIGAFGALLAFWGLWWGISGWGVVDVERGWSAMLAGAFVFGAGSVVMAIAALMHRVDALIAAVGAERAVASALAPSAPAEFVKALQRDSATEGFARETEAALKSAQPPEPPETPIPASVRVAAPPPPPPPPRLPPEAAKMAAAKVPEMPALPSALPEAAPSIASTAAAGTAAVAGAAAIAAALGSDSNAADTPSRPESEARRPVPPPLKVVGGAMTPPPPPPPGFGPPPIFRRSPEPPNPVPTRDSQSDDVGTAASSDLETPAVPVHEAVPARRPILPVPPLSPAPERAEWPEPPAGVRSAVDGAKVGSDEGRAAGEAYVQAVRAPTARLPFRTMLPAGGLAAVAPVVPPEMPSSASAIPDAHAEPSQQTAPADDNDRAAPDQSDKVETAANDTMEMRAENRSLDDEAPEAPHAASPAGDGLTDIEAPVPADTAVDMPSQAAPAVPPYAGSAWVDKLFAELDEIKETPIDAGEASGQVQPAQSAHTEEETERPAEDVKAQEESAPIAVDLAAIEAAATDSVAEEPPLQQFQPEQVPAHEQGWQPAQSPIRGAAGDPPLDSDMPPLPPPPDPVEAAPVEAPPPQPRVLVRSYESQGVTYHLYEDGSIDAETSGGTFQFASLDELREFIEKRSG